MGDRMAGARGTKVEPNYPAARYPANPGAGGTPPAIATNSADQARENATRRTVAECPARQRGT
jgi:hypothetical protein